MDHHSNDLQLRINTDKRTHTTGYGNAAPPSTVFEKLADAEAESKSYYAKNRDQSKYRRDPVEETFQAQKEGVQESHHDVPHRQVPTNITIC